jgi:hypothetical protein
MRGAITLFYGFLRGLFCVTLLFSWDYSKREGGVGYFEGWYKPDIPDRLNRLLLGEVCWFGGHNSSVRVSAN